MKFLIFIILVFFAIFVFLPSLVLGMVRFILTLLGGRSRYRNTSDAGMYGRNENVESGNSSYRRNTDANFGDGKSRKKVFDDNEGEYVSFEEIDKSAEDKDIR